ncbi:Appr-1-p processing protein [Spongiactinospora rosea]|uniref:Appr-1-p processing protein n=2 Tax=Spongiactinospora rosea TaxID=2248750 RepID=A0A366M7R3_9ACTN|nr:Appr-1-p processing protein [Spongiactinospora rosea]
MGKGIALAFKRRYPDMFDDYVERCRRGEVQLGVPYVYRADDHLIVNFPTKQHWRAVSRLDAIVAGLKYLEQHYREWGITSLAVPPLGCGNGQLEWEVVGPTLYRHLARLDIPVELYAPSQAAGEQLNPDQLALALDHDQSPADRARFVEPEWIAIVAILDKLQRQPHHWPVGRVMFQKLTYFATQAGIPTGLDYEAGSYGPYASDLKRMLARLQNNGLVVEEQRGRMLEVRVGATYRDAVEQFRDRMEAWRPAVDRTVDLMARMDTQTSEVAASVHFATTELHECHGRPPLASEVLETVEEWKAGRNPPLDRQAIIQALLVLALRGWIEIELDKEFEPLVESIIVP